MERMQKIQRSLYVLRKNIDIIDEKNMKIYRSDVINESIKVILKELEKLNDQTELV